MFKIPLINLLILAMEYDVKTNTELITRWLNDELTLKADLNEAQPLIRELYNLHQILPLSCKEFKVEKEALTSWLNLPDNSTFIAQSTHSQNTPLEQLKLKYIVDRPLVAFLATHSDDPKISMIRSTYLFVCLKLVVLTKHDSRIKQTLTECRLLESKKRSFLIPFLPDFTTIKTLSDLLSYFQSLENTNFYEQWKKINSEELERFISNARANPHEDEKDLEWTDCDLCNHRLSKFLYNFSYPLTLIYDQKRGVKKITKQQEKVVTSSLYEDEITGNSISTLSFITEKEDANDCFEVSERQDDEKYAIEQVIISRPTNYYIDKVNADQQANCRRLRSMSQVTDVNIAHFDEILVLLDFLIHTLKQIDLAALKDLNDNDKQISFTISHQAALYIFILLLTGTDEMPVSDRMEVSFNALTYKIIFKPTRSEIQDDWNSQLCAKNTEDIYGYLSERIGCLYDALFAFVNDNDSDNDEALKHIQNKAYEQLKDLNKSKGTRLSLNKVKAYLAHYLLQKGYDHAIVSVLTNKPIHSVSALPYFNASQLEVYKCQSTFYDHLRDELISSKRFQIPKEDLDSFLQIPEDEETDYWDKQTGTVLAITESALEPIISSLKKDLDDAIKRRDLMQLESVVDLHNLFTDYLYLMLAASTGYRPVTEPFGRLQHIDTRTSKYFISDKENHQDSIGRFIYLPQTVTAQIIAFYDYLDVYVQAYGRLNYAVSQIFNDILMSKTGLITYLKYDQKGTTIYKEKINNTYLAKRLAPFISLPLNWSRHFIRSYKINGYLSAYSPYEGDKDNLFGYDVIGAFMGHADELGYSFLGKFSGLKSKELRRLSYKLNDLLETCGFGVVKLGDLYG